MDTVTRFAFSSLIVKVTSAIIMLSCAVQPSLIFLVPAICLWVLDGYYLALERAARDKGQLKGQKLINAGAIFSKTMVLYHGSMIVCMVGM